jgi:hypothetical protein
MIWSSHDSRNESAKRRSMRHLPQAEMHVARTIMAQPAKGTDREVLRVWDDGNPEMEPCRNEDYFYTPLRKNTPGPHETEYFDWVCYPLDPENPDKFYPDV